MLDEDHRVVVVDGSQQQSLGVIGVGGHDHLQARHMHEPVLKALGVLGGGAGSRPARHPQDERHGGLAAEHEAHLGRLQDQLLHRERDEVHELDLADGPHAGERRADARPGDGRLGDGRVADALRPELSTKPGC